MLNIEHTKAVAELMREIGQRPAFKGVGALVVLFDYEGDMAIACPDGLPAAEILRDALNRVTERAPDQTATVGTDLEKN